MKANGRFMGQIAPNPAMGLQVYDTGLVEKSDGGHIQKKRMTLLLTLIQQVIKDRYVA